MSNAPKQIQEQATKHQKKKVAETRDCPCEDCSGTLERIDIWMHDNMVLEKYSRKNCDCDCERKNPVGQHYRGRSKGRGCLKGEF